VAWSGTACLNAYGRFLLQLVPAVKRGNKGMWIVLFASVSSVPWPFPPSIPLPPLLLLLPPYGSFLAALCFLLKKRRRDAAAGWASLLNNPLVFDCVGTRVLQIPRFLFWFMLLRLGFFLCSIWS
jgi:hypothetical protein